LIDELRHECGVAALYWLGRSAAAAGPASRAVSDGDVTPLMPPMLLDLQNRGQLAAGLSSYNPSRPHLLMTFRDVGTVIEAFRMSQPAKHASIMREYAGRAAIGHTRYATCGADDVRYAQPFERFHGRLWKWFSFAFNGNLANYSQLRQRLLSRGSYHFTLNTDTEIIQHMLAYKLRGDSTGGLKNVMSWLRRNFDGAYNIAFLDAMGRMFIARDPLGFRPMSWAVQGRLFAAASESVALSNMGFTDVRPLQPGQMIIIEDGRLRLERFAPVGPKARCFFEWIYFSNVASVIDGAGVYQARSRLGRRLAELEDQKMDSRCVVVPVPDTAKGSADAFAYHMGIPCVEGLIRNRYIGRTFIQPNATRIASARSKYTPLPAVLKGKRVFLIEDSIVRAVTLAALAGLVMRRGGAAELHVRVACPPITTPCFYGIDMTTINELFAPRHIKKPYPARLPAGTAERMARELGVTSLRYLGVDDLAGCIGADVNGLCEGCVSGKYPTCWGNRLYRRAVRGARSGKTGRTYE